MIEMRGEVPRTGLARRWGRFSLLLLFVCSVFSASGETDASSDPSSVCAVHIDGREVCGTWLGLDEGKRVKVRSENGLDIFSFDDLLTLTFPEHKASKKRLNTEPSVPEAPATRGQTVFYLADGGRLTGAVVDGPTEPDTLACRTGWGKATIPFDRLAGVQLAQRGDFPRAAELFDAALTARLPGEDVLVTRGEEEEVKTIRGRLVELNSQGGTFIYANRPRPFRAERIYGVILAMGATAASHYPLTFELSDGSLFSAWIERADGGSLRLAISIGMTVDLPTSEILNISVDSDRVVYLSDLSIVNQRNEGILHRSWPVMMDRSISGGPLSINGRVFDKGIGVHSFTEVSYDTEGKYETFAATIGIDDSVRPRGNAVFRVLGDGTVLFESGAVTGRDRGRDIIVDVVHVNQLTLIVNYGDELDLADYADWGGARLLKPAQAPGSPSRAP